MRKSLLIVALLIGFDAISLLHGQTPAPVLMQPSAVTAATPVPATSRAADNAAHMRDMLQLLEEMQNTNAGTIKKQEAALATLDQLQKAAEEIKIFSKRG